MKIKFTVDGNINTFYTLQIPVVYDQDGVSPSFNNIKVRNLVPSSAEIQHSFVSNSNFTFIKIVSNSQSFTLSGKHELPRKYGSTILYENYLFSHNLFKENVSDLSEYPYDEFGFQVLFSSDIGITAVLNYEFYAKTNLCGISQYNEPNLLNDFLIKNGTNFHPTISLGYECS